MLDLSLVVTAPMATAPASTGCTGLEAVNPRYAVGTVGSLGGSVAAAGVDVVLGGHQPVGGQWRRVVARPDRRRARPRRRSTSARLVPDPLRRDDGAGGRRRAAHAPRLDLQAIVRQSPGQLVRTYLVQLPLALLLGVVAIQIVICASPPPTP